MLTSWAHYGRRRTAGILGRQAFGRIGAGAALLATAGRYFAMQVLSRIKTESFSGKTGLILRSEGLAG